MNEPVKIVVIIEGGSVSQILSAGVPVDYVVVDYDLDDDPDGPGIHQVPQTDGGRSTAFVSEVTAAEIHGPRALELFALASD